MGGPVRRLPRGATLGRYVVLDCLGSGGMGVVYRAHDFALDRRVSLKLLRSGGKDSEARRERLIVEAQALARVSHPNVLTVHDVGSWEDEVYLALEHVEGETLAEWLDRAPRTGSEIRGVFLQAARGLQAIHDAGLIHRDVKPENILVGRDGRVRVADLGLAVTAGGAPAPETQTLRPGTPGYMPLEQHRGESLDARADQFSLAVALHEALLGERPYGSRGTSRETLELRLSSGVAAEVPPSVPPRLRRELARALQPDRARRAETLLPLIDALASPGITVRRRLQWPALAAAVVGLMLVPALNAPGATASDVPAWLPPLSEYTTEPLDALERLADSEGSGPAAQAQARSGAGEAQRPAETATPALALTTPGHVRPAVLVIGQRGPTSAAAAPAPGSALPAMNLAELRKLLEGLLQAVTEHRDGDSRPLLALGPPPSSLLGTPGAAAASAASATSGGGPASVEFAQASFAAGGSRQWADNNGTQIDSIERRLSLQVEQHRSTSEIAETRFVLAQVIWDSSDAEVSQVRALSLARQSKAALATVPVADVNPDVEQLRQNVDDWIDEREGPMTKPRGGRMVLNPHLIPSDP